MKSSTCGARGAEEPRPKAVSGRPQERPGKEGASAAEVRPAAARGGLATLRRLLHQLHDALLSYLVVSPLQGDTEGGSGESRGKGPGEGGVGRERRLRARGARSIGEATAGRRGRVGAGSWALEAGRCVCEWRQSSHLERAQGGAAHEGRVVRGEVVQLEELAHLQEVSRKCLGSV